MEKGNVLSTIEAGTIFGEMAYFGGEQRRTATVLAKTDVVLRKISTDDFHKLPVIMKIFEQIAMARRREIGGHRQCVRKIGPQPRRVVVGLKMRLPNRCQGYLAISTT